MTDTESSSAAVPQCPFCGSDDVERELSFGSALSKRQYCCLACTTVFEGIRWVERRPSAADQTQ